MLALRLVAVLVCFAGITASACSDDSARGARPEVSTTAPDGASADASGASADAGEAITGSGEPAPPVAASEDGRSIVVLDPGHGGPEVGAANHGVVEKDSNLDMALRVERLLLAEGVEVVLTRRSDARASSAPAGPGTFGATRADLQARVDLANSAIADVFVSIHSNGSTDAGQRGIEVWYDPLRPFGAENLLLADLLRSGVLAQLSAFGYSAEDRGSKDDSCFRFRFERCFQLFVLGPERRTTREEVVRRGANPDALGFPPGQDAITTRATAMPGALVELLFISNQQDAAVLAGEAGRAALARGVRDGLLRFLARSSAG